jgi:hypothetical protein
VLFLPPEPRAVAPILHPPITSDTETKLRFDQALRDWLVVSGPEAGHIWHDATADLAGWGRPTRSQGEAHDLLGLVLGVVGQSFASGRVHLAAVRGHHYQPGYLASIPPVP